MRIKKIIASSMKEGREIIERELGNDAIILSHRNAKLPSGVAVIEFVAALDESKNIQNSSVANSFNNNSNSTTTTTNSNNSINLYENSAIFAGTSRSSTTNNSNNSNNTNSLISSRDTEISLKIAAEISSLRETIAEIADNVRYKYTGTMPEALARVYKTLRNSDISEEFALDLVGRVSSKGLANDYKSALNEVQRLVLEKMQFANPINKAPVRQIISFYGATGSGKTTSLIKLAIVCKLLHKSKVLIVSADTNKVGGVEQLQTLASISGIAFAAVYNFEDLREIVKNENNYDLILIDTAGCNPNNNEDMLSLMEYHKASVPDLRFLVLSATSSESSTLNVINKFTNFGITSSIITKVDESIGLGNIVSALNKSLLPMSYFATGTKIPDDLELASSDKLYEYLLVV